MRCFLAELVVDKLQLVELGMCVSVSVVRELLQLITHERAVGNPRVLQCCWSDAPTGIDGECILIDLVSKLSSYA
jgi:hypothetical protein